MHLLENIVLSRMERPGTILVESVDSGTEVLGLNLRSTTERFNKLSNLTVLSFLMYTTRANKGA